MKKTNVLKRAACAIVALLSACLTACSGTQKTYSLFGNSGWLTTAVNETCVYGIEYKKPESDEDVKLSAEISPESSLTTKLYYGAYEGTPCYVYETQIIVKGSYLYDNGEGEKSLEFSDSTLSKCYFLKEKLSPLYSEKIIENTAPTTSGSKYAFLKMHYSVKNSYDKQANKITCVITDLNEESEESEVDSTAENNVVVTYPVENSQRYYEKYDNNYVDNELLSLLPRLCKLEDGFYHTFTSLDASFNTINTLKLAVNSSEPTFEYTCPKGYVKDGISHEGNKITAFNASVNINSSFSGSYIYYGYAANAGEDYRLLTVKTELAYSLGSLNYSLKSVTTK